MKRKHSLLFALLLAGIFMPAGGKTSEPDSAANRWATKIEASELRNAHKVCDELYRGGRLAPTGAAVLKGMGVKTVVSLRVRRSDWRSVGRTNLDYIQIPVVAERPTENEVVQFLRIATDKSRQPVYVYCNYGSDRTGMMCAVYRIVVCGWSKEEAIREMTQGSFGYHQQYWQVVSLVRNLDVERIKRRAGVQE